MCLSQAKQISVCELQARVHGHGFPTSPSNQSNNRTTKRYNNLLDNKSHMTPLRCNRTCSCVVCRAIRSKTESARSSWLKATLVSCLHPSSTVQIPKLSTTASCKHHYTCQANCTDSSFHSVTVQSVHGQSADTANQEKRQRNST